MGESQATVSIDLDGIRLEASEQEKLGVEPWPPRRVNG
jgi:hypothetical protein